MTSLQLFSFNDQSVRVLSIDGDPWFVANDVLNAIKSGTKVNALKSVISEGLGEEYLNSTPLESSGGIQETTIIHESAVTFLVSRSRTETGKAFNRLLHTVILPTIRKTGKYEVNPQFQIPQTKAEALRLAADLEDRLAEKEKENQILLSANQSLEIEVQTLEPKADRYDLILATDGWMTGEEIVKQLNIPKFSVRKLYDILRQENVLFKRPSDGTNLPYATWTKDGLATIRDGQCFDGRMRFSPAFSWKGLDRILDILRKHQIIPKDKQYRFNFESSKIVAMKRA